MFIRVFFSLMLLTTTACSHKPYSVQTVPKDAPHATHAVYVLNHGWHTAFTLPAQAIQQKIPALKTRFPNASYLTFGWGDTDVYQADEVTFWASTYAIMLPTDAVIHVLSSTQKANTGSGNTEVQALCLKHSNYQSLLQFVEQSFSYDSNHHIRPTPLNDGESSQFYQAEGSYYFMNTCNNWTAKGLQSAGFDISPTIKFTASSIMGYLEQDISIQTQPCLKSLGK